MYATPEGDSHALTSRPFGSWYGLHRSRSTRASTWTRTCDDPGASASRREAHCGWSSNQINICGPVADDAPSRKGKRVPLHLRSEFRPGEYDRYPEEECRGACRARNGGIV